MKSEYIREAAFHSQTKLKNLAKASGQTPHNLNNKLARGGIGIATDKELENIAQAMGAKYYAYIEFPDGSKFGCYPEANSESDAFPSQVGDTLKNESNPLESELVSLKSELGSLKEKISGLQALKETMEFLQEEVNTLKNESNPLESELVFLKSELSSLTEKINSSQATTKKKTRTKKPKKELTDMSPHPPEPSKGDDWFYQLSWYMNPWGIWYKASELKSYLGLPFEKLSQWVPSMVKTLNEERSAYLKKENFTEEIIKEKKIWTSYDEGEHYLKSGKDWFLSFNLADEIVSRYIEPPEDSKNAFEEEINE